MRLTTPTDVRDFLKRVPKKSRASSTWQHVEATLKQAAAGGDATEL